MEEVWIGEKVEDGVIDRSIVEDGASVPVFVWVGVGVAVAVIDASKVSLGVSVVANSPAAGV